MLSKDDLLESRAAGLFLICNCCQSDIGTILHATKEIFEENGDESVAFLIADLHEEGKGGGVWQRTITSAVLDFVALLSPCCLAHPSSDLRGRVGGIPEHLLLNVCWSLLPQVSGPRTASRGRVVKVRHFKMNMLFNIAAFGGCHPSSDFS